MLLGSPPAPVVSRKDQSQVPVQEPLPQLTYTGFALDPLPVITVLLDLKEMLLMGTVEEGLPVAPGGEPTEISSGRKARQKNPPHPHWCSPAGSQFRTRYFR